MTTTPPKTHAEMLREEVIETIRARMMEIHINRMIQYAMGTYELEEGEIVEFDFTVITGRIFNFDEN